MRPTGSSARMNMARSGSVSSIGSSTVHENTPRADLRGSPQRQQQSSEQQSSPQRSQQARPTTNGVGVRQFVTVINILCLLIYFFYKQESSFSVSVC